MRSSGVLCAAALLLASVAAGAAEAGPPAASRLTFALPQPGHVTLAEVRLRLPDVQGKRLRLRVPVSLPDASSLPPGAKALSTVLARRSDGATVYTILLAAVNPQASANAAATSAGLPVPIDRGFVAAAASGLYFSRGRAAPPAQPIAVAVAPPQAAGFATSSRVVSFLDPVSRKQFAASVVEAADVDQGSAADRAAVLRQLAPLGTPQDVLLDRRAQHAQYDAGHPLGWKAGSPTTKRAAGDAWSLLTAAPQDLAAVLGKLETELGIAGTAAPPPPAASKLYRFSLGAFQFSFDAPPAGNPPQPTHVTYSVPGATACGTDPASAAWALPYTVNAGAAQSGSVTVRFADANPFQIYLFFDYLPPGSITAPLATLSAALSPVAGASPQMKLIIAAGGAVANVSAPTLLPVMAMPVSSC